MDPGRMAEVPYSVSPEYMEEQRNERSYPWAFGAISDSVDWFNFDALLPYTKQITALSAHASKSDTPVCCYMIS